jgi:hypothetical protein
VSQAKKHKPFTRFDNQLPLRGRWLRYAAGAFFAVPGLLALLFAGFTAWSLLVYVAWTVVGIVVWIVSNR